MAPRVANLALALLLTSGAALRPPAARLARRTPAVLLSASPAEPAEPKKVATWPCGDALDKRFLVLSLPAIVNFMIMPITSSVDLFWIGKLGSPLAISGQAAADQIFSSAFWLVSVIPTVTTPLVAKAHAAGDEAAVQRHIGSAIFLSLVMGLLITAALAANQRRFLLGVGGKASLPFSLPYLRLRLPGVLPDTVSTVGFSAFRGVQNTVLPLYVALASNLLNCALDPLLMFKAGLGVGGAALATSLSQALAGAGYVGLLLRQRLVRWGTMLRPPSRKDTAELLRGGAAAQVRNVALNLAFFSITRTTQRLDTTGVSAAAHSVAIKLWSLGGTILFAVSTVASVLVSAELGKADGGPEAARPLASRFLAWGAVLGGALAVVQLAALRLIPAFTSVREIQAAARTPYIIGTFLQLINGLTFVGEGIMVGTRSFGALAAGQVLATGALIAALRLAPPTLVSVWLCFWLFNGIRLASVLRYHFLSGPLAPRQLRAARKAE